MPCAECVPKCSRLLNPGALFVQVLTPGEVQIAPPSQGGGAVGPTPAVKTRDPCAPTAERE
jgi:hypothetical protein